jgi:hypothetical protein
MAEQDKKNDATMLEVSESALRGLVAEALDNRGPVKVMVPKGPVVIDPVIAKDAPVSDPVNPSYTPQDATELQIALPNMVKGIDKSEVPRVYRAIKDVVASAEPDEMKQDNLPTVEAIIRQRVRDIIGELPARQARLQKILEAPVKGTEDLLQGEPVPEPHEYDTLYKKLYAAVVEMDDDALTDVLFQDSESSDIMADAADALMAIANGDPAAQKIARRVGKAMPSELAGLSSQYLDVIDQNAITPNPNPPQRSGTDDTTYDKTPEDLEQLKQREKLDKEKIDKLHGSIAAEMGTSPSSIINIERTGKVKMILYYMWEYDKKPGDQETFEELADVKMLGNTDPALQLGWATKITAAALMGEAPKWLEEGDKALFTRCQKGYEVFAAGVERFGEVFDLSDEEAILFALETDPYTGGSNKQEHKFFSETFDEIAKMYLEKGATSAKEKDFADAYQKWQGLRSFLIYWGQDADKLLDKVMRIYNVSTMEKKKAARAEEDAAMGRAPRGTPKKG